MSTKANINRRIVLGVVAAGVIALVSTAWFGNRPAPDANEIKLNITVPPVILVNDSPIYDTDVQYQAQAADMIDIGENLQKNNPNYQIILDELVDQRLLALAAKSQGLEQRDSSKRRLSLARERSLGDILIEEQLNTVMTDDYLKQLYDAQNALRAGRTEVRARQIILTDEESANNIVARLEKGEPLGSLAAAYSLDRVSRDKGGDMGYFAKDMLDQTLTNIAFSSPKGEIKGPFETQAGWHVLEVTGRRNTPIPDFEDVKKDLESFTRASEVQNLISSLRNQATITAIPYDK